MRSSSFAWYLLAIECMTVEFITGFTLQFFLFFVFSSNLHVCVHVWFCGVFDIGLCEFNNS